MAQLDRLSALISHFRIRAERLISSKGSNLVISGPDRQLDKLVLFFGAHKNETVHASGKVFAKIDFGGQANPLIQALPDCLEIDLVQNSEILTIAKLIAGEVARPRCGGRYALDRLCELLVVSLLRHRIEQQVSEPGMFTGLSHPKLSHVLVAIHDEPGQAWRIEDLAQIAGMSRSQFMTEFRIVVGKTPAAYLKHWRMSLARIALLKGARVKEIARRFGYSSGDAFSRAFTSVYGLPPTEIGKQTTL